MLAIPLLLLKKKAYLNMVSPPNLCTEKQLLTENLKKLLIESNKSVVISIKGSWGIGKSHYWREFANGLNKKKYAYVSLFGKTSIKDVKTDIINQISSHTKFLNKLKDKLGASNFAGIDISASLSLLSKEDFQGIIICFDDLERVSKSIDINDVIGLVSELKEQKECKIIIINNIEQLKDSDLLNSTEILEYHIDDTKKQTLKPKYQITQTNAKNIFELSAEKIIDYEFWYNPTIEENFTVLENEIKFFNSALVLFFLTSTNTNDRLFKSFNIRLLRQYINKLDIFVFLKEHDISHNVRDAISAHIFELIYEKKLNLFEFHSCNIMNLEPYINNAIAKSFLFEKDEFIRQIKLIENELDETRFQKEVFELYDKFIFDINYSSKSFKEGLFNLFNSNIAHIIKKINFTNFSYFVDLLKEIDPDNKSKYDKLFFEAAKKFIDEHYTNSEFSNSFFEEDFITRFKSHPSILEYIDSIKEIHQKKISTDTNKLIELLQKPMQNNGWSQKDIDLLSSISVETHKLNIKKSAEYFQAAFQLSKFNNSFSGEKPFKVLSKNFLDAVKQIMIEDDDYALKFKFILGYFEPT